jgi:hypothetical protein
MAQSMGYTMGYILCPVRPGIKEHMEKDESDALSSNGYPSPVGCNVAYASLLATPPAVVSAAPQSVSLATSSC